MTSNARCSMRRLAALAIATSSLSGCATVSSEPGIATACPPVVEYSREVQARAAEELEVPRRSDAGLIDWGTQCGGTRIRGREVDFATARERTHAILHQLGQ